MATGVLVLGVNRATRLLGHLMLTEKAYDATIRLGVATTTDDAEGEVTATASAAARPPRRPCARRWRSSSATSSRCRRRVSAIKVDGKRAYQRVRDGEDVELKAAAGDRPRAGRARGRRAGRRPTLDVDVSVRCSSGTYIRAIARDLGARLGVGGHLTALRRTAVGPYDLAARAPSTSWPSEFTLMPIAEAARRRVPGPRPRRGRRPPTSGSAGPGPRAGRADRGLRARTASSWRSTSRADEAARAVAVFV